MEKNYVSDETIIKECYVFPLTDDMKKHLNRFLASRKIFHADESLEHLTDMKHDYEIVYTDLKLAYHMGIMREADFYALIQIIKSY